MQNLALVGGEAVRRLATTANTARFRIQTTENAVVQSVQTLLTQQVSVMMLRMQINTALNMQMFHPVNPLPMGDLNALICGCLKHVL